MIALVDQIRENISRVQTRIDKAETRSGRQLGSVKLVVVTKAQPITVVEAAIQAGAKILGENYPEETISKLPALEMYRSSVEWHMIGHLQSRKARLVCEHFDCFQALDSVSLSQKLDRILAESQRRLPVLLEFNVSGEESKFGFSAWDESHWSELLPDIAAVLACQQLQVNGVMTMPPIFDCPEDVRPFFIRLRRLASYLNQQFPTHKWGEISMGTSSDFEIAVEEGATLVRVGTSIVGPRPVKPQ